MTNLTMSNARRSAILLLALDEDSAAAVFRHLTARDVQEVSQEMARMENISHEEMRQVLEDFHEEAEQYAALSLHSSEHIRSVLENELGAERAASSLDDILDQN